MHAPRQCHVRGRQTPQLRVASPVPQGGCIWRQLPRRAPARRTRQLRSVCGRFLRLHNAHYLARLQIPDARRSLYQPDATAPESALPAVHVPADQELRRSQHGRHIILDDSQKLPRRCGGARRRSEHAAAARGAQWPRHPTTAVSSLRQATRDDERAAPVACIPLPADGPYLQCGLVHLLPGVVQRVHGAAGKASSGSGRKRR